MASKLRVLIPLAILVLAGVGLVAHTGFGNLSALGWESISVLCPIGAIVTMLASKTIVPRALISIAIAVIAIVILGRAFCGWICPVPVISKLRTAFKKQNVEDTRAAESEDAGKADADKTSARTTNVDDEAAGTRASADAHEEKSSASPCASCPAGCHRPSNSRHIVLGAALLSAAIFGFPVFCLVCPIGLSFALVFVLINLFTLGDATWSAIAIPALLLVEVVFFRRWCSHICPVSSLMSLIGKLNRSFRPHIDNTHCVEAQGRDCGKCAQVCEMGIDPRHPERGAGWEECSKCRACVEACPGKAISMPPVPKKQEPLP